MRTIRLGWPIILASLAACNSDFAGPDNINELPSLSSHVVAEAAEAVRIAAVQGSTTRGAEDDILRFEREVPGLGGVFVSPTGVLTMYLPAGVAPAQARARIASIAAQRTNMTPSMMQLFASGAFETRIARFPFSELVAYKELLRDRVLALPNISGLDADESLNRVRISVSTVTAADAVREFVASLDLPPDLIVVTLAPRLTPAAGLRSTWRPTGGGIKIQTGGYYSQTCTLGFNVTTSAGHRGFVTAAHCEGSGSYAGSGYTGAPIFQPLAGYSQYVVGSVAINPAWVQGCGAYHRCTSADAMLVSYTSDVSSPKRVAYTSYRGENSGKGSLTVTGWWANIVAPAYPFVGQSVDKQAQTTGWTSGTVAGTCEEIPVDDDYGDYVVGCADRVTGSRVGQGDSGGSVFVPPPPGQMTLPLYPLGILFAGGPFNAYDDTIDAYYCTLGCTYAFSRFDQISAHLGVTVSPGS